MNKIAISIPIYHYSDKVEQLKDAGLEYDIKDCIIKYITFFDICGVGQSKEGYAIIYTPTGDFESSKTRKEIMDYLISIGYVNNVTYKMS